MVDPYRHREPFHLTPPAPLVDRRPRVLAHVHRYHPTHNAGAEAYLHNVLVYLAEHGWEVQVLHAEPVPPSLPCEIGYDGRRSYTFDGIPVVHVPVDRDRGRLYQWADVVLTHLHSTRPAVAWHRQGAGRPLVHLVHNHRQLHTERVKPDDAQLVVWNSRWVEAAHADQGRTYPTSMVLHPPIAAPDPSPLAASERFAAGSVLAVNLAVVKGGPLVYELAARRPADRFVGIEGAYDLQWSKDVPPPQNMVVIPNGAPALVRDVLTRARVALVPSYYESWGMFACEAIAAGVPVIAADTPGLREALTSPEHGPAAMFIDGHDPTAWSLALTALDDIDEWERWMVAGYRRAAELAALRAGQLALLEMNLAHLAGVPE